MIDYRVLDKGCIVKDEPKDPEFPSVLARIGSGQNMHANPNSLILRYEYEMFARLWNSDPYTLMMRKQNQGDSTIEGIHDQIPYENR